MKKQKVSGGLAILLAVTIFLISCKNNPAVLFSSDAIQYTMPSEENRHQGTWLQWPHNYTYSDHVERMEVTFIEIARALHTGEEVYIVVYDAVEQERVSTLLRHEGLDMSKVDFFVWKTDDVWSRDNGPVFTYDNSGQLVVQDWGFNGWGRKAPYKNCDKIPRKVASALDIPLVNVDMVNEGGSIEIDGKGTLMAKRSSILNPNRNPGWTQEDVESYFKTYLGVTHFIWLEGVAGYEITDDHIDSTARFVHGHTIVTHIAANADPQEHAILRQASNANGKPYNIVGLPLTKNNLPGTSNKGIYLNFYVGNEVVLVPHFNDPNDEIAKSILQSIYPNRAVVGIPTVELGIDGGGVHCVTQQQPASKTVNCRGN